MYFFCPAIAFWFVTVRLGPSIFQKVLKAYFFYEV